MTARRVELAVLGSGPGAATAAAELARAGRDVLILEEGPDLPQESCAPFSLEELRTKCRSGGLTAAFGPGKIAYVEGRVVGGGSEVNSGIYRRTPPQALERWARDFGLQAATERELAPHFEACERELGVSTAPPGTPAPLSRRLEAGARRAGLSAFEAPRMFEHEAPAAPRQAPGWKRRSMSRTFIPRALRAGAQLEAGARAARLARAGKRWLVSVERAGGGRLDVEADAVFLGCGAVQTPALLRRSGLAPAAGRSLSLHPMLKVVAEFPEDLEPSACAVEALQLKDEARGAALGCSASAPSTLALALAGPSAGAARRWRRLGAYYAMATAWGPDAGTGRVRALPFFRDPLVSYRLGPGERAGLRAGLELLARALFAAGARRLYPSVGDGAPLETEAQARRLAASLDERALRLTSVHLMASCPMGERPGLPLDSFGAVRGGPGLVVCDASALCGPVGANTQATVMAFARRNALRWLGEL